MKIAIVHDWIVNIGGAEQTVLLWHKWFPEAPIYTLVYDEQKSKGLFSDCDVRTTYLQKIPFATKLYKSMLTLMPRAWEALDLTEYDVVLSSCSSCCKGVITRPDAVHICYCHTPTRYVWDLYHEYRKNSGFIKRALMPGMIHKMRLWDYAAAQRVDHFIANSNFTKQRIRKFYRRDAAVIFSIGSNLVKEDVFEQGKAGDFYLCAGRLVGYKRVDIAVEACNLLNKRLIVVGTGEEEEKLKKIAGPLIEFKGRVSDEELQFYYANAKAFLFPGLEDFGFTPIEAQSGGCPVLAYGKGGVLDTVLENKTGKFFHEQSVEAMADCIKDFEENSVEYSRTKMREHALTFSQERFKQEVLAYIENALGEQGAK